jgi:hypothetical protein
MGLLRIDEQSEHDGQLANRLQISRVINLLPKIGISSQWGPRLRLLTIEPTQI